MRTPRWSFWHGPRSAPHTQGIRARVRPFNATEFEPFPCPKNASALAFHSTWSPPEMMHAAKHYCRHCRTKLKMPVDHEHHAFCAHSCYSSFYRSRCLVCEEPLGRTNERQRFEQRQGNGRGSAGWRRASAVQVVDVCLAEHRGGRCLAHDCARWAARLMRSRRSAIN
jgi:hypothetical protein